MCIRHRQNKLVPVGAALWACVNAGRCTGLMGAESGSLQILNPTWHLGHLRGYFLKAENLQGQGSGASRTLISFLPVSACLPKYTCLLPWPGASQPPEIHRKHFVCLGPQSAMQAGQTNIFGAVKGTSI